VIGAPFIEAVAGQTSVTAIAGAVVMGHVAEAVFVTPAPVQASLPLARTAVVMLQTLSGTVKVPE